MSQELGAGVAVHPTIPPLLTPTTHSEDLGHDGLWPRQPGYARLVHVGEFSFMGEAVDRTLALIRGGQDQGDAVRAAAAERGVDPVRLALRVGGELTQVQGATPKRKTTK